MNHDHRRIRSWWRIDPETGDPASIDNRPQTIQVLEAEADTADTGILDKDGQPIHRTLKRPIGFVHFPVR